MNMVCIHRMIAAIILFPFSSAVSAQNAQEAPQDNVGTTPANTQSQLKAPDGLSGDWGGMRTDLRDAGLDLNIGYTNELSANVSGGDRHDVTAVGQVAIGATVDTDRMFGLLGGTIQATITYRHGKQLDARAGLGTLQQTQEVYGAGQTWRLSELYYQQQIGATDVKLGRLTMSSDFNTMSCDFQNLTFCGSPAGNLGGGYWFNSPVSQWGARLRFKQPEWYAMAGVYESNPNNLARNTFAISHSGAKGVTIPVEAGWTPHLGSTGLPGIYKAGFWYNTVSSDDVLVDRNRQPFVVTGLAPLRHEGRFGGYVMIQQQVTGTWTQGPAGPSATHGLSLFLNYTQADRQTSRTDNQIAAGLVFTGPFKGRPRDDIGLAFGRTNVNERAAVAETLASSGGDHAGAEYAAELHYSLQLMPWLTVRPNAQYVLHPGGYGSLPDVVVLGLKSALTF